MSDERIYEPVGEETVQKAFDVYVAICHAQGRNPKLAKNPYFNALRDTAYSRFMALFEALQ